MQGHTAGVRQLKESRDLCLDVWEEGVHKIALASKNMLGLILIKKFNFLPPPQSFFLINIHIY